jgi:hypothetical protein
MNAQYAGNGLAIFLTTKDKSKLENDGTLECRLLSWKKPQLFFHLVEEVKQKTALEEPGFHIDVKPPRASPEFITRYDIYLSKDRFKKLTVDVDKFEGGYFVSRSLHDRVELIYWDI